MIFSQFSCASCESIFLWVLPACDSYTLVHVMRQIPSYFCQFHDFCWFWYISRHVLTVHEFIVRKIFQRTRTCSLCHLKTIHFRASLGTQLFSWFKTSTWFHMISIALAGDFLNTSASSSSSSSLWQSTGGKWWLTHWASLLLGGYGRFLSIITSPTAKQLNMCLTHSWPQ